MGVAGLLSLTNFDQSLFVEILETTTPNACMINVMVVLSGLTNAVSVMGMILSW